MLCIDNIGWIQDSNPIVTHCNPIETVQPQEPITEEEVVEETAPATQETTTQEAVTGETHGGCHAMEVSWGITDRMCSADIAEADDTATSTVTDTTSPIIGSATFTCNGTSWRLDTTVTSTCTNEVFSGFGGSIVTDRRRTIVGSRNGGVHIYETINPDGTLGGRVLLPTTDDIDIDSDFGDPVSISGDYAIVGAPSNDNERGTGAGSAYIYERDSATGWGNPIPLTLPTRLEKNSFFGFSVAISPNYAIVGARGDNNERGISAGSAYIYERVSARNWGNPTPLTLPNIDGDGSDDTGLEENSFFGFSVAIDGDYAIVGAGGDDNELGLSAGSAYIYERVSARNWGNPTPLTLPNIDGDGSDDRGLDAGSGFGRSVAIDGDYAIVGAYTDDNKRIQSGSAYIYERVSAGNWGNPILLTLPSPTPPLELIQRFGNSVAIDGNYAIVGASDNGRDIDGDGERDRLVGSAYIYERLADGWNNPIALTLPTLDSDGSDDTGLEENSLFGFSVAIDGDYAIVGAVGDENEIGRGSAYTYSSASARNWDLSASTTRTATLVLGCVATTTPQTWTVGTNICSANLIASGHGDMISLDNTAASLNGSATFTCNASTWEVDQSTAICAPVGGASVSSSSSSSVPQGGDVVIDVSHSEMPM